MMKHNYKQYELGLPTDSWGLIFEYLPYRKLQKLKRVSLGMQKAIDNYIDIIKNTNSRILREILNDIDKYLLEDFKILWDFYKLESISASNTAFSGNFSEPEFYLFYKNTFTELKKNQIDLANYNLRQRDNSFLSKSNFAAIAGYTVIMSGYIAMLTAYYLKRQSDKKVGVETQGIFGGTLTLTGICLFLMSYLRMAHRYWIESGLYKEIKEHSFAERFYEKQPIKATAIKKLIENRNAFFNAYEKFENVQEVDATDLLLENFRTEMDKIIEPRINR